MSRRDHDPAPDKVWQGGIPEQGNPAIEALVRDIIGKEADKWTTLILQALHDKGTLRYTQLRRLVGDISQKMLTQTVRRMEEDGLVNRTVHPVIPPHVDYQLTPLGDSLSKAFCGVWVWAEQHYDDIQHARQIFAARQPDSPTARQPDNPTTRQPDSPMSVRYDKRGEFSG